MEIKDDGPYSNLNLDVVYYSLQPSCVCELLNKVPMSCFIRDLLVQVGPPSFKELTSNFIERIIVSLDRLKN